jgi:4-hydroxyphenylpyruvate dioxygenase
MATLPSLGIKRLEALHYYVHDLARSSKFYVDQLDFAMVAKSSAELEKSGKQTSEVFAAGDCVVVCSAPQGEGGRAWRFLKKHPDGVGSLIFEVEDADKAFALLEARGGTALGEVETHSDAKGQLKMFSITTPFGDTTFRFVERRGYGGLYPGMHTQKADLNQSNKFNLATFDHITSNFQTMKPALLWMEHVLGCEPYWKIEFHTDDVSKGQTRGSGLRSQVMWEPQSGIKFANNEPYRPFFKQSQINLFTEEHRGDGIQHVAVAVKNILDCVQGLRERQVGFMSTPGTYYDALPQRLQDMGIKQIDEDVGDLRRLQILVDGAKERQYLLQIFLQDAATTHHEAAAGPFFYELIQRKGDQGFGGGNFRALFESIERAQQPLAQVSC